MASEKMTKRRKHSRSCARRWSNGQARAPTLPCRSAFVAYDQPNPQRYQDGTRRIALKRKTYCDIVPASQGGSFLSLLVELLVGGPIPQKESL